MIHYMKITIKTTNLRLTPAIKREVEEKIGNLDKFISNINGSVEGFVEVAVETRHHHKGNIFYAEANIKVPRKIIRAETRQKNLYQAVNELKYQLQGELKKYKEKKIYKKRRVERKVKKETRDIFLLEPQEEKEE